MSIAIGAAYGAPSPRIVTKAEERRVIIASSVGATQGGERSGPEHLSPGGLVLIEILPRRG